MGVLTTLIVSAFADTTVWTTPRNLDTLGDFVAKGSASVHAIAYAL